MSCVVPCVVSRCKAGVGRSGRGCGRLRTSEWLGKGIKSCMEGEVKLQSYQFLCEFLHSRNQCPRCKGVNHPWHVQLERCPAELAEGW